MKYEIKIEFNKNDELKKIINSSYFEDGSLGKLSNGSSIEIKKEDPLYIIFKGLNNMTVRIMNHDLIDGTMRFVIDEQEWGVNLFPCSIYCIVEDEKYSFY